MLKAIINRLKKKEFRDAFVRSHLTHGLAHQIRELRIQRGWTQKELAEKLELKGQSAVARMEDPSYGKLSIATLIKLSSVFDVALSVRFQSYGKFLMEREDVSPAALRAESFENEMPKIIESMDSVTNYINTVMTSNIKDTYPITNKFPSQAANYKAMPGNVSAGGNA
jgi:transcriptional regulator with XRE-family HTH domain